MGEWGIERLTANCFRKENYDEKEKVLTVYTHENQKNMKFALKKNCHILQSSSIGQINQDPAKAFIIIIS